MARENELNPWVTRLGLLLVALALGAPAARTLAVATPYDHEKDDGHEKRCDPSDPPDPDDPSEPPCDKCNATGSPVFLANGDLMISFTDLVVSGNVPHVLSRTFHSKEDRAGLIGHGWTHTLEARAIPWTDGTSRGVIVRWTDGFLHRFTVQPDGTLSPPTNSPLEAEYLPGGEILIRDERYYYRTNLEGDIESVSDSNGANVSYVLDPSSHCVTSLSSTSGTWDVLRGADGRIASISGPGGASVSYSYDASGNMVSVTNSAGATDTYAYDSLGRLTLHMTAAGQLGLQVSYDAEGRVSRLISVEGDFTFTYSALQTLKHDNVTGGTWVYDRDATGVVVGVTTPAGDKTQLVYDSSYKLTALMTPNGGLQTYSYDRDGALAERNNNGSITSNVYDDDGNVVSTTNGVGATTAFTYDTAGNPLTVTEATGTSLARTTTFAYDAQGNVVQEVDALGATTTFQYDTNGHLTKSTDALGQVTTYEIDVLGRPTATTDAKGNKTAYSYDVAGNLAVTVFPDGLSEQRSYNAANQLTSITDANGNTTSFDYDSNGNLASTTSPLGATASFLFDSAGHVLSESSPTGEVISFSYDPSGRVLSKTSSLGGVTSYSYDSVGNLAQVVDPLGKPTSYAYDLRNNLVQVTAADSSVTSFEYDFEDKKLSTTFADGATTYYSYDELGRLVTTIDTMGCATGITYDPADNVIARTDELGHATQFAYDSIGQLVSTTDPLSGVAVNSYDAVGNLLSTTDPAGYSVLYSYDSLDRIVSISPPGSAPLQFTYDGVGNLVSFDDAAGTTSAFTYDSGNNQLTQSTAGGAPVTATYDAASQLLSLTDPVGNTEQYAYDAAGRLLNQTLANGAQLTFAYDLVGNLTSKTDALGHFTQYGYDSLGRLTSELWDDGTQLLYSYDAVGHLLTAADDMSTVAYSYDAKGRTTVESRTTASHVADYSLTHSYDCARRTSTVSSLGATVDRVHDDAGRLVGLTYSGNVSASIDLTYDERGYPKLIRRQGGTLPDTTYAYDSSGRLASLQHGSIDSYQLTYDAAGHISSITDSQGTHAYSYGPTGAVVAAAHPAGSPLPSEAYSYDAAQNRLTSHFAPTVHQVGPGNTLLDDGGHNYSYDAGGNLVSTLPVGAGASTQYSYDRRGRLESATSTEPASSPTSATYGYDALNRRISMVVDGTSAYYAYDGMKMVAQHGEGKSATSHFLQAPSIDDWLFEDRAGAAYWYLGNHIGSVTAVVDGSGGVAARYSYDSFGRLVDKLAPTFSTPFGFAGRTLDPTSHLYYFRGRDYDPETSRFTTPDGFGSFLDSVNYGNGYAYAGNDPVSRVDPIGAWSYVDFLLVTQYFNPLNPWLPPYNISAHWSEYAKDGQAIAVKNSLIKDIGNQATTALSAPIGTCKSYTKSSSDSVYITSIYSFGGGFLKSQANCKICTGCDPATGKTSTATCTLSFFAKDKFTDPVDLKEYFGLDWAEDLFGFPYWFYLGWTENYSASKP